MWIAENGLGICFNESECSYFEDLCKTARLPWFQYSKHTREVESLVRNYMIVNVFYLSAHLKLLILTHYGLDRKDDFMIRLRKVLNKALNKANSRESN